VLTTLKETMETWNILKTRNDQQPPFGGGGGGGGREINNNK